MKYRIETALLTLLSTCALSLSGWATDANTSAADNSKKNERDRSGETKTPVDQSNRPEDLKVTQSIRKAVVKDGSLSMTAKNVKIITAEGKVTLRGPVNTAEEKKKIEGYAKASAGKMTVVNQIEVKTTK
jgi:osmotically-inducible protein OsmY